VKESVDFAEVKVAAAKTKAGQRTLKELKKALEGSKVRVHEKPDTDVTILEVMFQDGLDVDIFNFSLSGLKCRVLLEVKGTAAELAAMLAAGATEGAMKKVVGVIGMGDSLAQAVGGLRDHVHAGASEGSEVKSVEFDLNLDLGVRKAGEEVSTGVTLVGDTLDKVNQVIPVKTATKYVEQAIAEKVKEIIKAWAKDQVKSRTGVDYDATKEAVASQMAKVGLKK